MSPTQKPEWFEITDADNAASTRKVSKGLPVMALVVTASILGIGSIFAQTSEESPASAIEITTPAVQSTQSTEPSPASVTTQSTVTQTSNGVKAATTSKVSFTPQATSVVSPSAPTMKNPSIATLPTGGGDDDDEGDDEDDDD